MQFSKLSLQNYSHINFILEIVADTWPSLSIIEKD